MWKDHSIPTHSGYQHVIELYSLHILNALTLGIHVEKASTTHKVIDSEPAGISCSWACMPSSSVVLHWNPSKVDCLDPFSPSWCRIWPNSSYAFNHCPHIPQWWHSMQPHHIMYGHAVEHSPSLSYQPMFGKHFIVKAIMYIHI
jgi:hypothetical protein